MQKPKLDEFGLEYAESEQAQRGLILDLKHQLRQYFNDTLHKLEKMLVQSAEARQKLSKFGYERSELERNIVPTLTREAPKVVDRFPGANSISFHVKHMDVLNVRKTVVCEKTDGVRYFLCEFVRRLPTGQLQVNWFLVDRKYTVRQVALKYDMPPTSQDRMKRGNTFLRSILDGELVWDDHNTGSEWQKKHPHPLFLVFDALVVNGTNLMPSPFTSRLIDADAYLRSRFTKARLVQSTVPKQENVPQIDIFMKEMFRIQDAHVLFEHILPRLEHENDGLIFTIDAAPYYMGTCPQIWKWKPMHLNTIDFNSRPIQNGGLPLIWSLHTSKGELFDFIVLSEVHRAEYCQWRSTEQTESVVECNYDHKLGENFDPQRQKMLVLINTLKLKHSVDEDEQSDDDERMSFQEKRHRQQQSRQRRQQALAQVLADLNAANLDSEESKFEDSDDLLGGWNVHRQRTDKSANALQTAESILKTILNPVYEDELKDLLEMLQDADFGESDSNQPNGSELGKRPRNAGDERPAEDDFDDECF